MKKIKDFITGILVIVLLGGGVFWVYRHEKNKTHEALAKRIAELSPRGGPPETIEGLKAAIALYEAQIELNVKEGAQTGSYWKILAVRLADKGMHQDALSALERALYYNAEDPTLFYLTGVSAATAAKAALGFSNNKESGKEHYFALAETAYLRSLEIDSEYPKPMYGLGVLYVFELDRPAEAVPYLEHYLKQLSGDISAMFVLARAYYMTGNNEGAVELYDRIISRTKDQKIKAEAQNNRDYIRGQMYGRTRTFGFCNFPPSRAFFPGQGLPLQNLRL
jgi:tetratricopeptide (TPR) repeat protein